MTIINRIIIMLYWSLTYFTYKYFIINTLTMVECLIPKAVSLYFLNSVSWSYRHWTFPKHVYTVIGNAKKMCTSVQHDDLPATEDLSLAESSERTMLRMFAKLSQYEACWDYWLLRSEDVTSKITTSRILYKTTGRHPSSLPYELYSLSLASRITNLQARVS